MSKKNVISKGKDFVKSSPTRFTDGLLSMLEGIGDSLFNALLAGPYETVALGTKKLSTKRTKDEKVRQNREDLEKHHKEQIKRVKDRLKKSGVKTGKGLLNVLGGGIGTVGLGVYKFGKGGVDAFNALRGENNENQNNNTVNEGGKKRRNRKNKTVNKGGKKKGHVEQLKDESSWWKKTSDTLKNSWNKVTAFFTRKNKYDPGEGDSLSEKGDSGGISSDENKKDKPRWWDESWNKVKYFFRKLVTDEDD